MIAVRRELPGPGVLAEGLRSHRTDRTMSACPPDASRPSGWPCKALRGERVKQRHGLGSSAAGGREGVREPPAFRSPGPALRSRGLGHALPSLSTKAGIKAACVGLGRAAFSLPSSFTREHAPPYEISSALSGKCCAMALRPWRGAALGSARPCGGRGRGSQGVRGAGGLARGAAQTLCFSRPPPPAATTPAPHGGGGTLFRANSPCCTHRATRSMAGRPSRDLQEVRDMPQLRCRRALATTTTAHGVARRRRPDAPHCAVRR